MNTQLTLINNTLKLIAAIQDHPECGSIFHENGVGCRMQEKVQLAPTTLQQLQDAIEASDQLMKEQRGWVFTNENEEEIGFAAPEDYRNGQEAYEGFAIECGDHFNVYFKDSKGELNPVDPESTFTDFE